MHCCMHNREVAQAQENPETPASGSLTSQSFQMLLHVKFFPHLGPYSWEAGPQLSPQDATGPQNSSRTRR